MWSVQEWNIFYDFPLKVDLCGTMQHFEEALSFTVKKKILPWTNRSISRMLQSRGSKHAHQKWSNPWTWTYCPSAHTSTTQAGISRKGQCYFKGKKEKSSGHPGQLTFPQEVPCSCRGLLTLAAVARWALGSDTSSQIFLHLDEF